MRYYPLFIDLEGRRLLVAGGGERVAAKLRLLVNTPARIEIFAEQLCPETAALVAQHPIRHLARTIEDRDFGDAVLAFVATGDAQADGRIAAMARRHQVPVNVVDRLEACDFISAAIVERGPVTIAISSGGAAPALARHVKNRIDALLPSWLGAMGRIGAEFQAISRSLIPDPDARRRFWDRLFTRQSSPSRAETLRLLNEAATASATGRVLLVGAGPGDPDLLTLKAHRALSEADVLVHDKLVSDEILAFARRDAARVYVGKSRGDHAMAQDDINQLLIDLARQGKTVVRLKGGDPFLFGRGGEELAALHAAGVEAEIIPGITAALGCAASAGIPLTHRDHASVLSLVAGQRQGLAAQDWRGLAGPGRTLAIYMGVGAAAEIAAKLIEDGIDPQTPVAIIENGTRPNERRLQSRVDRLAATVEENRVTSPSLIIIGDVAALGDAATLADRTGFARAVA